jgi:hypothetical protein
MGELQRQKRLPDLWAPRQKGQAFWEDPGDGPLNGRELRCQKFLSGLVALSFCSGMVA